MYIQERVSERPSWNPQRIQVQDSFLVAEHLLKNYSNNHLKLILDLSKNRLFPDSLKHVTYDFILMIMIKTLIALLFLNIWNTLHPLRTLEPVAVTWIGPQMLFIALCQCSCELSYLLSFFCWFPYLFKTALKFADLNRLWVWKLDNQIWKPVFKT